MTTQIQKVRSFHRKQKFPRNKDLTSYKNDEETTLYLDDVASELLVSATMMENRMKHDDHYDLRVARAQLMIEELGETILGLANCDEILTLDGLSDLAFVAIGTADSFDLPLSEGLEEVCDSNLTKSLHKKDDSRVRDKGPNYRPPNLKKVLSLHRGVEVRAFRTDCCTGLKKETMVLVKKYYSTELGSWWIRLIKGGVTGHESIEISKIPERLDEGWFACMSTSNKWDELFLPGDSMREILAWLKETE